MRTRLAVTLLAGLLFLPPSTIHAEESAAAPAAVRRVTLRFRPGVPEKGPRDDLKLDMRLSLVDIDPGLDASRASLALYVGETCVVSSSAGDGGKWKRVRARPWTWSGKLESTPGCVGVGRLKLDLRKGALIARLKRIDLGALSGTTTSSVPVRLVINADEFLAHVDFSVRSGRWDHRDPKAAPPWALPPREPPDDEPEPSPDGPVAHTQLRSDARYRGDAMPGIRGKAISTADWVALWSQDWAQVYGPMPPWVNFDERMVVTFAGFSGSEIASMRFERKGDDLVGYAEVRPQTGALTYRVFACYAVPRVTGNVTFEVTVTSGQSTQQWTLDCPRWPAVY